MLGVLVITGEYSTGMIRATFVAVPEAPAGAVGEGRRLRRRHPRPDAALRVLIAFFGSQAILRSHHILQLSFSHPGVARAVLGGGALPDLVGVFALGLGAILRNTAGRHRDLRRDHVRDPAAAEHPALGWNNAINPYLPSNAGRVRSSRSRHGSDSLAPWPGFALFCGYTALSLAIAAVLLVRRDT